VTDAAIHHVSENADDLSLRLLAHSRSPRAFSPRDDKSGVSAECLSLRGGCASDRRGNLSCLGERGRVCLFGL
jgi:hypothetical protein